MDSLSRWEEAKLRARTQRERERTRRREAARRANAHRNFDPAAHAHKGETWCAICQAWRPRPHTHGEAS